MSRQVLRRKPTLVVSNPTKPRRPVPALSNWGSRQAKQYGEAILRGIKADGLLKSVDYFTREALLLHFTEAPAFGRVSTITRYQMIREGVTWLIRQGELITPNGSRRNLCLPNHERRAVKNLTNPLPLHLRYRDHIQTLIQEGFTVGEAVDVMAIVRTWSWGDRKAKPGLTEDNMRVLARQTLRAMAKAPNALLRENADYTYTTLPLLYQKEVD